MRALVAGLVALSIVSGGMAVAQTAAPSEAARRWWSHVEFLASDAMKGRNTGSDELKAAAEYIARQFADAGLVPAASGGFFQPVAFRTRRIVEAESSLALIRDGKAEPLALGPDATFSMRIDPAPSVDARLVFAGYGLVVPEANYDDLAGLDVKGAVVVHLSGSPSSVPGPLAAHFSSAAERWAALRRAGAVGIINIPNPKSTDVPWERSSANRLATTMALADPAFDETTGQQLSVTVNPASAGKLFAGAPSTFAEIVDLAEARKPLPRFALPVSIRATTRVETASVDCRNVAGLLKGSDPALSNEYVVLSAHMDHVGVGAAIAGDNIYNGAMDNASGVATLIETARMMTAAPTKPKRSVVFLAVTAEEKGLLGSRYFAARPTVPVGAVVADVNMDMFLPLYPLKTLMVLGLAESSLGDNVRRAAAAANVTVQADLEPQRNRFTRSDQYSFIRRGVPSIALKVGYEPDSEESKVAAVWTRDRYHAPSDDLQQPLDLKAAADFTALLGQIALDVANDPSRPQWKDASFFRRFANGTKVSP